MVMEDNGKGNATDKKSNEKTDFVTNFAQMKLCGLS